MKIFKEGTEGLALVCLVVLVISSIKERMLLKEINRDLDDYFKEGSSNTED